MAAFRLIPKEEKFYADFIALADRIVSGATLLEKMLATDPPAWEMGIEIKQVEQACDTLTHEIIQRLNQHLRHADRPRGHPRARQVARRRDGRHRRRGRRWCAATASRRCAYGARELASLIWRSAMQVRVAVEALEKKAGVHDRTVEINRLENAADELHDEALRRLFEQEKDAHHDHQVQGDARPARTGDRSRARTSPTSSRASSSSTGSAPWNLLSPSSSWSSSSRSSSTTSTASTTPPTPSPRSCRPGCCRRARRCMWAAFFNFAAAFGFGTAVARPSAPG